MESVSLTAWLTMIAILLGPIIAVQLTRFLDDRKTKQDRKLVIYRTLIATRAANLSPGHVEALNTIDIEFNGTSQREQRVREAWKAYLDHLGTKLDSMETWTIRRLDLLIELLFAMGQCLGYNFDKTHLKNSVYAPQGHGELESDQAAIRRGFKDVLEGRRSISIRTDAS